MRVKDIVAEDFVNYKCPAMFIISSICNWKCCVEQGVDISVCQNQSISLNKTVDIPDKDICERYLANDITKAIVIGGLEPFEQFDEVLNLLSTFRDDFACDDTFVIYTGYYPEEISEQVEKLKQFFKNIIIKFGRYVPDRPHRYDEVLGVELVSDNQFAEQIC